jgi:pyruvate kinase
MAYTRSISPKSRTCWRDFAARWLPDHAMTAERVMLVAGPSPRNPNASHRIELMRLG